MSNFRNKILESHNISFTRLDESHFSLLLKWLETPHVKKWWDEDIKYTRELIYDKYISYTQGYKISESLIKPVYPFIINIGSTPIGYIQFYNFYDFLREYEVNLSNLPNSLAAFDLFIGDHQFIHRGLGGKIIELFIKNYIFKKFENCFVDPVSSNIAAIKAYKKAGFTEVTSQESNMLWLIKRNNS